MEYTDVKELEAAVEGILFASGEPVGTERICFALSLERAEAESVLRRLQDYYAFERRGMRLLQLEDRWQLCSSPDHADAIRKAFEIRKPAKLSQPALEALTIIAYYQPTTRAYVDKLRGVDSSYTVSLLLERGFIETCGHLQAPGRPLLYRTTEKFLRSFHLSSLEELPPLNADDAPNEQMKIEELPQSGPPVEETDSVTEGVEEADSAPEAVEEADSAPEAVEEAESASEAVEAADDAPEAVEEADSVTEAVEAADGVTEAVEEADGVMEAVEEADDVSEAVEAADSAPEAVEAADGVSEAVEAAVPARELMSTGSRPRIVSKFSARKRTKRGRRVVKRLAGTFRVKRKGVRRTKRRDAPSPETANPPRKRRWKALRRCLHCLLCGLWASWPWLSPCF